MPSGDDAPWDGFTGSRGEAPARDHAPPPALVTRTKRGGIDSDSGSSGGATSQGTPPNLL